MLNSSVDGVVTSLTDEVTLVQLLVCKSLIIDVSVKFYELHCRNASNESVISLPIGFTPKPTRRRPLRGNYLVVSLLLTKATTYSLN